jgi:tetratricopeptide (TPR) repeat protein
MAGSSYGLVDPKRKIDALERINKISMAYGTGDFVSAVRLAQDFLSDEPDNGSVRQFLADALRGLEKYDEALAEYATILKESPNNVDVLLNIGFIQSKQGNIGAARETYLKTLELHPNHIYALSSLGNLYFVEGNYPEAAEYYLRVLADRPTHWKSIVAMAQINRDTGHNKEAKFLFRRAIEINPKDLDSALTLGWMHFVDKENEEALATLDAADRSFPGLPEILISRGDVLSALGRLDEAERAYRAGIERAPQAAQAWHGLGRIAAQRGDKPEARRLLEQALRINPGSQAAREELLRLQ